MIKKVMIEFANPRIRAVDHFSDIYMAADYAHCNLLFRYKVLLKMPYVIDNRFVILELDIPDEKAEKFSCGNHLRGISNYLLKGKGEYYRPYCMGKRLLFYIEVPNKEDRKEN